MYVKIQDYKAALGNAYLLIETYYGEKLNIFTLFTW